MTGLSAKKIPIMGDEQHRASYWDKRDIENQIRVLLKNFDLVIGRAKMNTFSLRAQDLLDDRPELAAAVEPLLRAREARQIAELDGNVTRLARASAPVRRLMTAPGVASITVLCYLATTTRG